MARILLITGQYIHGISRGSDYRLFYLLESLLSEHQVTWFSIAYNDTPVILQGHKNLTILNFKPTLYKHCLLIKKLTYYFGNTYPEEIQMMAPLSTNLRNIEDKNGFDIVFLSYLAKNSFIKNLKNVFPRAKIVIDTNDIQFERYRIIEKNRSPTKSFLKSIFFYRYKIDELKALKKADRIITLSRTDKQNLQRLLPGKEVSYLPIGVNISKNTNPELPPSKTLLFLGALDISPNLEALRYFISFIFPAVIRKIPEVELLIVGSNPSLEILAFGNENIRILGFVKDLSEVFMNTRALIFPHRLPYGSRVKVLEAMAHAVPSVIFKESIQGMDLDEVYGVFSVSADEEFIEKTIKLLSDDLFWKSSSIGVFEFSKNNFSNEVVYSKLLESLKEL